MDIKIFPKPLKGTVNAIPAKSHLHRVLVANFLSPEKGEIVLPRFLNAKDIENTKKCLSLLESAKKENFQQVNPKNPIILYCGESATTLRLLLPIVCSLGLSAVFLGDIQLQKRPILSFLNALEKKGISYLLDEPLPEGYESYVPLLSNPVHICTVSGKLEHGEFSFDNEISSQFVSGLLFALPLLGKDSEILLEKPFPAPSYINLTLDVLELFNIKVIQTENVSNIIYKVQGGQNFISPKEVLIEGDWSNAAFWLGANQLSPLLVENTGLLESSNQGDKSIFPFMKILETNKEALLDVADCPDLAPILVVLAATTEGIFTITNIEKSHIRESNRIEALVHNLTALGIDISTTGYGLKIKGSSLLAGNVILDSFGDHRIVMAMAIASSKCDSPITIKNFQAVNKSYPSFFEDFKKLGGDFVVL